MVELELTSSSFGDQCLDQLDDSSQIFFTAFSPMLLDVIYNSNLTEKRIMTTQ